VRGTHAVTGKYPVAAAPPADETADLENPRTDIEVLPTPDALMHAAAERWVSAAAQAIEVSGRYAVALAGGSTPQSLYALLAADPYASAVDWSRVNVFWSDERCVPPDDPRSNYRMAREALLARVPILEENTFRIRGEDEPAAAAAAYERELREFFATHDGPPRLTPGSRFDLVLLGMGEDGHTASLFPGMAAPREGSPWVKVVHLPEGSMSRVTLTPGVIDAAAEIVFLVSGRAKAATLQRVLEGPYRPEALPAQIIAPRAGRLRWLVDADAAANLEADGRGR